MTQVIKFHSTWIERFYARAEWEDGHLMWRGRVDSAGYGMYTCRNKNFKAHRISWELNSQREIPEGLTIDHLCRVKLCINPAHLEPVTARTNTLRSNNPAAQNARKTHCNQGHEFTPQNTYYYPRSGNRGCVICRKEYAANYYRERSLNANH